MIGIGKNKIFKRGRAKNAQENCDLEANNKKCKKKEVIEYWSDKLSVNKRWAILAVIFSAGHISLHYPLQPFIIFWNDSKFGLQFMLDGFAIPHCFSFLLIDKFNPYMDVNFANLNNNSCRQTKFSSW